MISPLDELYFDWLYSQVASLKRRDPSHTYRTLLMMLYTKPFIYFIPNDDNRVADGKELRTEFLNEEGIRIQDRGWMEDDLSMFELLISLARMLSFEDDTPPRIWFWTMMENIGLSDYNDRVPIPRGLVDETLDRIIWRTYRHDGRGGLFPLQRPPTDQRDVELWYQLNAYLAERL